MNEVIEQELKLSKKQNKNDRYNYLCSQFNGIEYAVKLEKYTNKLLKENSQLKQQLKDKDEKISKVIEYATHTEFEERTAYDTSFCEGVYNVKEKVLKILESNKED